MFITQEQIFELTQRLLELRTWHVHVLVPGTNDPQILIVRDAAKENAAQVAASIAKLKGWTVAGEPVEFVHPPAEAKKTG